MKPERVLRLAPSQWEARIEKMTPQQRHELEDYASGLAQRAALLACYVGHRYNTGCGDQGHEESAAYANRQQKKVRSDLGYSLPGSLSVRVP